MLHTYDVKLFYIDRLQATSNYGLKRHVMSDYGFRHFPIGLEIYAVSNYGVTHLPIDLQNAMSNYIHVYRNSTLLV